MFHYIENKNYNLKNDEYNKFNKQTSQYKQQKPIQNNNQGPVQNFNLYDQSLNENFTNNQLVNNVNNQNELLNQKIHNDNFHRDPTEVYYDKLKYERNNDLEKFKELQGGFLIE